MNAEKTTPAMAQFFALKARYPECLLFFRMGDFYELFFEDATQAAAALGITLTQRGSHGGAPIPMCGVPFHAYEQYLPRLIRAGFHVAVCEQLENPAEAKARAKLEKGGKSVVKRDVVRVVTPGTLTEDSLLVAQRNNYLAAIGDAGGAQALGWLDLSTGDIAVQSLPDDDALTALITQLEPSELLHPSERALPGEIQTATSGIAKNLFSSSDGERRLKAAYGVASLDAFGQFSRAELSALGALLGYVELTQVGALPKLRPIEQRQNAEVMGIDAATFRNLSLTQGPDGGRIGSLLDCIDVTNSAAGGRLLAAQLSAPSTALDEITARQEAAAWLHAEDELRATLRAELKAFGDIERAIQRLSVERGGPRDLAMLAASLGRASTVHQHLASGLLPNRLSQLRDDLAHDGDLETLLTDALSDTPPLLSRDGGFVRQGFRPDIDEQLSLKSEGRRMIAALEARYAQETGIGSLRIKFNKVLGYTVEVSAQNAPKLPSGPGETFIHRQTLKNAIRFTSTELAELETAITGAGDRLLALELTVYEDLRNQALAAHPLLDRIARAMAQLDVFLCHAENADRNDWVRPVLDDSQSFEITAGRHPVVEAALRQARQRFVPNRCTLTTDDRLWLLTGPNMAGKSTFLRQNALIAILAQMGSFVPAEAAHIGVVDRLFSRVGASDDLARGRSTFMVEMVETATILTQATDQSLVILDEIGRGTATYDGLSIAWATAEYLHDVTRARAIFATHYHELTRLTTRLDAMSNHAMKVKEFNEEIVFLHDVVDGAADRSYGVHVAKLAGLPETVVARARTVLDQLESGKSEASSALDALADLPLFAISAEPPAANDSPPGTAPSAVETKLAHSDLDALTPRAALELLYDLKELLP